MKKRSDKKIYFVLAIILVAGVVLGSKLTGLIALQGSLTKSPSTCTGAWDSCSGAFNRDGGTSAAYLETKDEEDTGRWGGFGFQIPSLSTIRNARLTLKLDLAKLIGNETGKARNIPANYFGGYIEYRVSGDGGRTFGPSHVVDYNTLISKKGKEDFEIGGSSLGRRQDVYWDLFTASLINDITLVPSSFNNDNLVVELTCFNPYREGAPLERGGHERTYCMADWIAVTLDFSYVTTTTSTTTTTTTTTSTTSTTTTTLSTLNVCTDSDGGKNLLVQGTTTGKYYYIYNYPTWYPFWATDQCNGNTLTEFYCFDKINVQAYSIGCSGATPYCDTGRCVSSTSTTTTTLPYISNTCTDTDEGGNTFIDIDAYKKSFGTKGRVYGYSNWYYGPRSFTESDVNTGYYSITDTCFSDIHLLEESCTQDRTAPRGGVIACNVSYAPGSICRDGACVSGTTTT